MEEMIRPPKGVLQIGIGYSGIEQRMMMVLHGDGPGSPWWTRGWEGRRSRRLKSFQYFKMYRGGRWSFRRICRD
jgi:hypothetical protein